MVFLLMHFRHQDFQVENEGLRLAPHSENSRFLCLLLRGLNPYLPPIFRDFPFNSDAPPGP